jgi:dTDP-4-amino-4,6-dideoxygalactose transaminase
MAERPEVSLFKVFVAPDAAEKTSATLTSGYITQGPRVEELEGKLGEFLQNPNTLTLNSATSGLHLALHMLKTPSGAWPGLKPGDEVLTTALTCTATNWPIMANGLKLKWVDVDPKNANINLQDLKYKLSPNTKVIQFVHWGGTPVDLDGIKEVVEFAYERFGFRPMVIEDAAHAIGAEWKGRRIGSLESGNICVFSTQAIKHLTTGDGGIITLPNKELYNRCKLLRWYGIDRDKRNYQGKDFRLESDVTEYGFKMHMNDLSATLGLANLPHLDRILAGHRANAEFYNKALQGVNGVTLLEPPEGGLSSYWIYTFHVQNKHGLHRLHEEQEDRRVAGARQERYPQRVRALPHPSPPPGQGGDHSDLHPDGLVDHPRGPRVRRGFHPGVLLDHPHPALDRAEEDHHHRRMRVHRAPRRWSTSPRPPTATSWSSTSSRTRRSATTG